MSRSAFVFAFQTEDAPLKIGIKLPNASCWSYRIANGKGQEITKYLNTELVTAAFGT